MTLEPGKLIMDLDWPDSVSVTIKHNQPIKGRGPYIGYLTLVSDVLALSNDVDNIARHNSIRSLVEWQGK